VIVPFHSVYTASEPSRDGLKSLEAKFGKVLDIQGEMAHSPVVPQSYLGIQQAKSGPAPGREGPTQLSWSARSSSEPAARSGARK
jgi:hypothetical protein